MIKSTFSALLVVAMLGMAIGSSESDNFAEPSGGVQMYTDVALVPASAAGEEGSAVDAITPYNYKAIMTQNSDKTGRKVLCWRCGSPCSHGFCCDDGYPQCCLVSGLCKCCRR